jgi:exosortase
MRQVVFADRHRLRSAMFPLTLGDSVSVSTGSLSNTQQVETRLWSRRLWVWSVILTGLILLLYAAVIKSLVEQWWTDADYGHGFFVPLFSGYILWHTRERWTKVEVKPSNFGFVVIVGAIALLLLGSLGAELFTGRFSLLVLLAGMILFLAGWKMLRAVSFPLGYLIWMIPMPVIIYNQITFPLQLIASRLATAWLELAQVPVLRDGNILIMSNYSLEVVEACSGIRSLMTLMALAVAYGYLVSPRRWVRYVLAAFMVPIAIVTNAIRIMGAGLMAHRFGPAAAEGFLHQFSGWAIFLVALLLMFGSYWILQHISERRRKPANV